MCPIVTFAVLYVMVISKVMSVGHHGITPYAQVVPSSEPRSAEDYLHQIYIHPTTSLPPISRPVNVCNECERRFILVQHQMEYAFAQLERLSDDNRKLQDHITNLGSQNERLVSRIYSVEKVFRVSPNRTNYGSFEIAAIKH